MASGSWIFPMTGANVEGRLVWVSGSNGAAADTSWVDVAVYIRRTNVGYTSYGQITTNVTIDGAYHQQELNLNFSISDPNDWRLVYAKHHDNIKHGFAGPKNTLIRTWGSATSPFSFDSSQIVVFDEILRYANFTSYAAENITYNSIQFSWAADRECTEAHYYSSGVLIHSTPIIGSSGSFTFTGLTENTYYAFAVVIKARGSGLLSTSNYVGATTLYSPPTCSFSLKATSINSFDIEWASNHICDVINVFVNDVIIYTKIINESSGLIEITPNEFEAIKPATTYNVALGIRRANSTATAKTSNMQVATMQSPKVDISFKKEFNIGESLKVPLIDTTNNTARILLQYKNEEIWLTASIPFDINLNDTFIILEVDNKMLFDNCPNSLFLPCRLAISATSKGATYTNYYELTGKVVNSNPILNGFDLIANAGTNINTVLDSTMDMIQGHGSMKLSFTSDSAKALNSAVILYFEAAISFNGQVIQTANIPYFSNSFTYDVMTSLFINTGTYTVSIIAVDSRCNKSDKIIRNFTMYPYALPRIKVALRRYNDFEKKIFINLTGEISKLTSGGIQKNSVISLRYRYKETGEVFSDSYLSITDFDETNGHEDNKIITCVKENEESYLIELPNEKTYDLQFILTDKLFDSAVFNVSVAQGIPAFAVFDDGMAVVNTIPDFNSTAKLQVGGDVLALDSDGKAHLVGDELNSLNTLTPLVKVLFLLMHPIGCIWMNTNATSPEEIYGGKWIEWGQGRVPVGVGSNGTTSYNTSDMTGGNTTHTHSNPSRDSLQNGTMEAVIGSANGNSTTIGFKDSNYHVNAYSVTYAITSAASILTGVPFSHNTTVVGRTADSNHMAPYITCFMWKRVS